MHCLLTALDDVIVIHDDIPADRDFFVQRGQGIHGRLVHVAVQAQQCQLLNRRSGEGVLEPALQELDLLIEQAILSKLRLTCSMETLRSA